MTNTKTLGQQVPTFTHAAPAKGSVNLPTEVGRVVFFALASGKHPWTWGKPVSVPLEALTSLEGAIALGRERAGEDAFWHPRVATEGATAVWRPWGGPNEFSREVVWDDAEGRLSWSSDKASTFIGGILMAFGRGEITTVVAVR